MLILLKKLDFAAPYLYAPPVIDAHCEARLILSVEAIETRRVEKCVQITFVDGVKWICLGQVKEIMEACR